MLTNGKKTSTIVLNSWISREVMEKEQGKLIIIVSVVFAMVLLCMICTSGSVPEVKSLQACTPEAVSVLDDGRELYDFILDQNDDETNSIVFYSAHQEIAVYADGKLIYRLDAVPAYGEIPRAGPGILSGFQVM